MDRTQARIVYWTLASLLTTALIAPLVIANLGGWIILLPILWRETDPALAEILNDLELHLR